MHRVIITGKSKNFPSYQKSPPPFRCLDGVGDGSSAPDQAELPTNSGTKPVSVAATASRCSKTAKLHTVKRSEFSVSLSPAVPTPNPAKEPLGTYLADKVVDVLTFISGMAVFGAIAMFFLLLA